MSQEQLRKEAAEKKYPMLNSLPNSSKITVANQRSAFKEGAEWEAEIGKWISVIEALPIVDITDTIKVVGWNGVEAVLVDYYQHKDETGGRFRVNCLKCFNDVTDNITHWQYITPPKKSKQ